jgi:thioredoxin
METNPFFEKLRQNPRPVVLDLWAPWCGPCKVVKPSLEKLGRDYSGRVDLWEVNADEHPDLLRSLRVYGIPTLIAYRGGKEMVRYIGAKPASTLKLLFETLSTEGDLVPAGITSLDRFLRFGAGLATIAIGLAVHTNWLLFFIGGLIVFSAIYDRCPIWRAITARFNEMVGKAQEEKP